MIRGAKLLAGLIVVALPVFAPEAHAQDRPAGRQALPTFGGGRFDARYPVRVLTIESALMLEKGRGTFGFGDTRYAIVDRRVEVITNTISDVIGVANVALKIGLLDPDRWNPGVAVGGKYYHSYPGLIDVGVRRIAESFSSVSDSEVDIRGWIAFATATWVVDDRTHYHLTLQHHDPIESEFSVTDDDNGGTGIITFEDGEDTSLMWGFDHMLVGTTVVLLAEAGYAFGLEQGRLGLGVDAGWTNWRVQFGLLYPGVETDLATEPRDFVVTPVISVHRRF